MFLFHPSITLQQLKSQNLPLENEVQYRFCKLCVKLHGLVCKSNVTSWQLCDRIQDADCRYDDDDDADVNDSGWARRG